jgi:hypothetical protein
VLFSSSRFTCAFTFLAILPPDVGGTTTIPNEPAFRPDKL